MIEMEQWEEIRAIVEKLELGTTPDILCWGLSADKKYTANSMFRAISYRGY